MYGAQEGPQQERVRSLSGERATSFLLARLGSLAGRSWAGFLHAHGLTENQFVVLTVLRQEGPQWQKVLANRAGIDPRNVVAVLASLAQAGLVERRPDPVRARRRWIVLTEEGARTARLLQKEAAAKEEEFEQPLTVAERLQLNDLLHRLYDVHRYDIRPRPRP